MKVRIKKCSHWFYWYKPLIGEEFDVIDFDGILGYRVEYNDYDNYWISKEDCEVIAIKKKY